MSRRSSYGRGQYGYVDGSSPKARPVGSLLMNWAVVIAILAVGAWKLEQDWSWYKSELLFYNSIQDGLGPADLDDHFMSQGIERNMEYKTATEGDFFWAKWKPKLPWYILGLFLPFLIGVLRLRRKGYQRLNVPYYIGIVVFLFVSVYFLGQFLEWF